MNMMKGMLIGCLAILLLIFALPYFGVEGVEGVGAYSSWLFFGLIFLVCVLPMLLMSRKKDNNK